MVLTHRFGGVKPSFLHGFWGPKVVGGFSPTHLKNMRKSIWIMSPGRDEHLNISNQHLAKVVNQHTELEHTPQNQSFTFPGVSRPGFPDSRSGIARVLGCNLLGGWRIRAPPLRIACSVVVVKNDQTNPNKWWLKNADLPW